MRIGNLKFSLFSVFLRFRLVFLSGNLGVDCPMESQIRGSVFGFKWIIFAKENLKSSLLVTEKNQLIIKEL